MIKENFFIGTNEAKSLKTDIFITQTLNKNETIRLFKIKSKLVDIKSIEELKVAHGDIINLANEYKAKAISNSSQIDLIKKLLPILKPKLTLKDKIFNRFIRHKASLKLMNINLPNSKNTLDIKNLSNQLVKTLKMKINLVRAYNLSHAYLCETAEKIHQILNPQQTFKL